MTNQSSAVKTKPGLLASIVKAGLFAGALGISGALLYQFISGNKNPLGIFKFIASGIFGDDAFTTGRIMILWGFLLHFVVALIVTAVYFLIYPKFRFLARNIVASGLFYGVCIWLVMNLIVLPISNTPRLPLTIISVLSGIVILMFAVGLPVAVLAYRYYSKKKTP